MVAKIKHIAVWERTKLGGLAPHKESAEKHLHLIKREEKFRTQKEFVEWVKKNGDHSRGYLLIHVLVEIDDSYDKVGGMVEIVIHEPVYYSMIHRRGEGWGQNKYGQYNYLPLSIGRSIFRRVIPTGL